VCPGQRSRDQRRAPRGTQGTDSFYPSECANDRSTRLVARTWTVLGRCHFALGINMATTRRTRLSIPHSSLPHPTRWHTGIYPLCPSDVEHVSHLLCWNDLIDSTLRRNTNDDDRSERWLCGVILKARLILFLLFRISLLAFYQRGSRRPRPPDPLAFCLRYSS
jgi:hypothetical protein